jgi:hypothetical protein
MLMQHMVNCITCKSDTQITMVKDGLELLSKIPHSIQSSWAISHVRWIKETNDEDRDGPRNVCFFYSSDAADCSRRFYCILSPRRLQIIKDTSCITWKYLTNCSSCNSEASFYRRMSVGATVPHSISVTTVQHGHALLTGSGVCDTCSSNGNRLLLSWFIVR